MKKINILKKNTDFDRIIRSTRSIKYKDYIIYKEEKNQAYYNFGISVSKKIGNAVVRNKIKRQLKNIIDEKDYKKDVNCIIIVRKGILNKTYDEKKNDLFEAFEKIDIYKGE